MADTTITALTEATGIDGATDWLAIDRTSLGTTEKINRNTYLGLTGSPVGTSDTQVLTNKTIGNTNTVTLKDTLFTLQDDGDTTKQAKFQLSGITTATTRTYTLPDASSTLADIATAQTLTNKTLTSPVITGGSITGSTITTDAIVGQSAATSGTVYGLSIASGKVGTDGVVTASITDSAVTYAKVTSGFVVQVVNTTSSAVNTGSTLIPNDDTIPQITEGDEYMTISITPKSTTNILVIQIVALLSSSIAPAVMGVALFQDATANALAATATTMVSSSLAPWTIPLTYTMTAGTTSATTFRVRAGAHSANTTTFNGFNGGRIYGAITKSSIIVTEYKA